MFIYILNMIQEVSQFFFYIRGTTLLRGPLFNTWDTAQLKGQQGAKLYHLLSILSDKKWNVRSYSHCLQLMTCSSFLLRWRHQLGSNNENLTSFIAVVVADPDDDHHDNFDLNPQGDPEGESALYDAYVMWD